MTELRKQPRRTVDCRVTVYPESGEAAQGRVYDLSVGGCAVACDEHLRSDTHVVLAIHLAEGLEPVSIELARVRWSMRKEFGVEFTLVAGDGKARIADYLGGR